MPIYEYKCEVCEKKIDKLAKNFEDDGDTMDCPCGAKAHRIISLSSFKVWNYDNYMDAGAQARKCGVET